MHGATHVEATRSRAAAPHHTCSAVLQPGGECVMSVLYSTIFCTVLQPGGL